MKHNYPYNFFKFPIYLLSFLIFLSACSSDDGETPIPEGEFLKSAELIRQFDSKTSIDNFLRTRQSSGFDPNVWTAFTRNGVKIYRVVYKTINTDGSAIETSGLVIIPFENTGSRTFIKSTTRYDYQ